MISSMKAKSDSDGCLLSLRSYNLFTDGSCFKSKFKFRSYFYAAAKNKAEMDVEAYLRRLYESQIAEIEVVEKEDLDFSDLVISVFGVVVSNHGGILAGSHENSEVDIVSNWNIAQYLLEKIQEQAANRTSSLDGSLCTPSITITASKSFEAHTVKYLKDQISSYFTEKLLGVVRDFVLHMKGVQHDVLVTALAVLRKNLLKYAHIKEFAPEAEFYDPCPPFILPNVICSYCNDRRDLDLCRDSALLADEWCCAVPQCGQGYDWEMMENKLLQTIRQRENCIICEIQCAVRCRQVKAMWVCRLV
ncbi:hypothetical protein V6N11_002442 [Hibiscus sabdariffa]|uniref:DNA polymerase epsilon catalytic subunit n=1 Tax=Hibiscus sabdariffa TaxID=183260 RepID=A0ABR2SAF2_9ROSI